MVATVNILYLILILLLLITGYVLQYATCFRQDNLSSYDPLILETRTPFLTSTTTSTHAPSMASSREIDFWETPPFWNGNQPLQLQHHHQRRFFDETWDVVLDNQMEEQGEATPSTRERIVNATAHASKKAKEFVQSGIHGLF